MATRYRTWVNNTTPAINANNLNAIEDRLPYISVKDKNLSGGGAVGDGTTDDTTSIQAAINAAQALNPQGTVYFPAGNYKITSALSIPIGSYGLTLQGEGRNSSQIIQFTNNTRVIAFADGFSHSCTIRGLWLTWNTAQNSSQTLAAGIYHPDTDTFGHIIEDLRISNAYDGVQLQQAGANTMWWTRICDVNMTSISHSCIVWKSAVAQGMPQNTLDRLYVGNTGTTPTGPCIDLNIQPCMLVRGLDLEDWRNTLIVTGADVGMPMVFDGVYTERHTVSSGNQVIFDIGAGAIFRAMSLDISGDVGVGNTLTVFRTSWPYAYLNVEGCYTPSLTTTNGTIHMYDYTGDFSDTEDGVHAARAYFRGMTGVPAAVIEPWESGATTKAKNTLKEWNGELYNTRLGSGSHLQFNEVTAPAAPAANKARLYVEDNGSGKSRLVVRFPTGAAQVIATEP